MRYIRARSNVTVVTCGFAELSKRHLRVKLVYGFFYIAAYVLNKKSQSISISFGTTSESGYLIPRGTEKYEGISVFRLEMSKTEQCSLSVFSKTSVF